MAKISKITVAEIKSTDAVDYTVLNAKINTIVTALNKVIDEVNNSIKYVSDGTGYVEVNTPNDET